MILSTHEFFMDRHLSLTSSSTLNKHITFNAKASKMHFGFKLHDSKSLERGRLIVLKLDPVNDGTDFLRCRSFGSLFYALLCYFDCTYRPTNERKRI